MAGPRVALIAGEAEYGLLAELVRAVFPGLLLAERGELSAGIRNGSLDLALLAAQPNAAPEFTHMAKALAQQPDWSDFPCVLIADRDTALSLLPLLGNVQLVERPAAPDLVREALRVAIRQRERQRQAEAHRLERQAAEQQMRSLMATLETHVRDRMEDLRAANEQLLREAEEREATESRLREREELYRFTVELSQGMVWTTDPQGILRSISPRYHELTGLPPSSAPREAIHPEDRERIIGEWENAIRTGQPHFAEYRLRMADGSFRHFRNQVQPRRNECGEVIGWYGLINDIHEQKQAEIALERAEERYRLAARATNNAIWDLDFTQDVIHWTTSEIGFFGYPGGNQTTSIGWWEERVHPDDRAATSASLERAQRTGQSHWSASYRFCRADGEYSDVFDQGYMIQGEDGRSVRCVGAMADLTELKRSEAEIRRVQTELIHVSRLSAMGAMASTLAHELNQPLTAVSSYIRGSRRLLAQIEDARTPRLAEALEAAEAGALRAGHMVRRLRELVARGRVALGAEELPKLIQEAITIGLVDAHLRGVSHRVVLDPEALWVEADAIQVQQVLINLIRNALQAMAGQERRELLIGTRALSRSMAEVSVSDTGCGIRPEVRDALFSPFQSSKEDGMGIGLSISRTIVEAHGGKIWVEDRPSGGTVFRFTLRRVADPGAAQEDTA
jgi:two-component system sensor kinase FixL